MAIACPIDLDTLKLRAEIRSIYARVATEPSGDFHFHRGPTYAAEMLGYDTGALAALPDFVKFTGVAGGSGPRRRWRQRTNRSRYPSAMATSRTARTGTPAPGL